MSRHETASLRLLRQRLESAYAGTSPVSADAYLVGCGLIAIADQLAYLGLLLDRIAGEHVPAGEFMIALGEVYGRRECQGAGVAPEDQDDDDEPDVVAEPAPDDPARVLVRCTSCGHRWREHGATGCAADDEAAMGGCDCPNTPPPSSGYGYRGGS